MTRAIAAALAAPPSYPEFLALAAGGLAVVAGISCALRRSAAAIALRKSIDGVIAALLAVVLLLMVFLSGLQIFLRNFFDTGLLWIDPLLRQFVRVVAVLGGLVATGRKRHIQISLLERFVSGRGRRAAGAFVAAAASVICLVLVRASLAFLADEVSAGESGVFGLPSWAILLSIPVGFAAFALRFAYLVPIELAGEAPRPEEEPDEFSAAMDT